MKEKRETVGRKRAALAVVDATIKEGTPAELEALARALVSVVPDGVALETDLANMHRMVARHCTNLRFVPAWGKWIYFDGKRWTTDEGAHMQAAKATTQRIKAEANELLAAGSTDSKKRFAWAVSSQQARQLNAMVQLARTDPRVVVDHESFDRDPWLLNVQNGTIDLRTGMPRPHHREDLINRICPVAFDPHATCPIWDAFVLQIMGGDAALVGYLQRMIGYALTGNIREHILGFFFGSGSNGKTTFLSTIGFILGDYAVHAARGLLFQKRGESHPTELTDLFGRRFVTCAEIEEGLNFDEALVKDITGGEPIRARRMREDFWQFRPTHKLFIAGNHKPTVRGTDDGIWRRLRLVPFTVTIAPEERDKDLPRKLLDEAPGILAWAVRGCLEWQHVGLGDPPTVIQATKTYREESDLLGAFFDTRLRFDPNERLLKSELTKHLKAWADELGLRLMPPRQVAARLKAKGATDGTMRTQVPGQVRDAWLGVALLERESLAACRA